MASEQVFSTVSDVYARPKRNRLALSTIQKLVFLNKCLPIIDYKYDLIDACEEESGEERDSSDTDEDGEE